MVRESWWNSSRVLMEWITSTDEMVRESWWNSSRVLMEWFTSTDGMMVLWGYKSCINSEFMPRHWVRFKSVDSFQISGFVSVPVLLRSSRPKSYRNSPTELLEIPRYSSWARKPDPKKLANAFQPQCPFPNVFQHLIPRNFRVEFRHQGCLKYFWKCHQSKCHKILDRIDALVVSQLQFWRFMIFAYLVDCATMKNDSLLISHFS